MTRFLDAALAYPTMIYTALLGLVLFYWLLAIVGLVDFEAGGLEIEADLQADADVSDLGTLAGYLVALGINGVPFSIVVSLMVLLSWLFSCLLGMWLLPLVPTALLSAVAGTAVLLLCPLFALPITARVIRPMRGLFVTHNAISNQELVGRTCKVLTSRVDETFGRAEVSTRGASVNISVWAETPNELVKGSLARIIDYDPDRQRYLIASDT
jgi:hypothetical protein